MVLEVVSSVTNWHGETDEASAMLTEPWRLLSKIRAALSRGKRGERRGERSARPLRFSTLRSHCLK